MRTYEQREHKQNEHAGSEDLDEGGGESRKRVR